MKRDILSRSARGIRWFDEGLIGLDSHLFLIYSRLDFGGFIESRLKSLRALGLDSKHIKSNINI